MKFTKKQINKRFRKIDESFNGQLKSLIEKHSAAKPFEAMAVR